MRWLVALLLAPPRPADADQRADEGDTERRSPPRGPRARRAVLHLHLLHEPGPADLVRDERRARVRLPEAARVQALADKIGHDPLRAYRAARVARVRERGPEREREVVSVRGVRLGRQRGDVAIRVRRVGGQAGGLA